MCKYEKGYNDTICDNLYDYPDEQVEVKRRKKTLFFLFRNALCTGPASREWLPRGWAVACPRARWDVQYINQILNEIIVKHLASEFCPLKAIAYSLFIGPISDHIGLKPLLLLPLLGQVIDSSLLIGLRQWNNSVLALEVKWPVLLFYAVLQTVVLCRKKSLHQQWRRQQQKNFLSTPMLIFFFPLLSPSQLLVQWCPPPWVLLVGQLLQLPGGILRLLPSLLLIWQCNNRSGKAGIKQSLCWKLCIFLLQEGRAARLGRFDGFEVTSLMIG